LETTEGIKRRIDSVTDLASIVRTMKTLAAVSIRQYEQAVEALEDYNRTVTLGLQVLLSNRAEAQMVARPARTGRLGAIIFGSDQGMCGQFNEQIASYALERLAEMAPARGDRSALAVGTRTIGRLEDAGQPVAGILPVPGSAEGITPLVQQALWHIDRWQAEAGVTEVALFYNAPLPGMTYAPRALRLLPVDAAWLARLTGQPWPSSVLPTFTMDWDRLFSALIQQYLFVSIYRACANSLASENAARLVTMQAAERNIEEHLEELNARYHEQRQTAITTELLDIVSGFEALEAAA
jgi:F-type H+-transporting ATPase subunit gamma